jgi:hypothetical protein
VIPYESEEDLKADPDVPLGRYRSAGMMAAFQIEAICFLLDLTITQCSSSTHASAPTLPVDRTYSTASMATTIQSYDHSNVEDHYLSWILTFPLVTFLIKCVDRLVDHNDSHIRYASLTVLRKILSLSSFLKKFLINTSHQDWGQFDSIFNQTLEVNLLSPLLTLIQSFEKIPETESMRLIIDFVIGVCSNELLKKTQVSLNPRIVVVTLFVDYSVELFESPES